ncbi:MAG: IPTL-CTERM sorting domain-containing protein, partial [Acidobacteria bacterium]|nr:IPTL-CTERM sorting domain-containing protein [Acidobacteriota bacterium]
AGVVVATPANASTTCTGGTITASAGTGVVSYTGGSVAAGASCTVQADVVTTGVGTFVNTTDDLTSSSGNSGTASDTLSAEPPPTFAKVFAPNPIGTGGVSTLTFTIDNSGNTLAATGLDFTDNLPAGLVVATPANSSTTCTGGTLTATAGTGVISYTGGSVAGGASCTVQADVTSATAGSYANLSGALTSSLGNSGTASDTLDVIEGTVALAKAFTSDPTLRGGFVDIAFTITNLSATFPLDSIAFTDDLDAALPGLVAVTLPANGFCGAGSQITGTSVLSMTGGSLPASGSCAFQVTVQVPPDAALGGYTNTTSQITATASGVAVTGNAAAAAFDVVFLEIAKAFDAASVTAGQATVLTFTLSNPDPANTATGITFTDDLDAVLSGLTATGLPLSDVCGAGSTVSGTSVITLTGGVLGPLESCTFDVTVVVPLTSPAGPVTNVTSPVSVTVGGLSVTGDAADVAQADIEIEAAGLAIPTLDEVGLVLLAASLALFALIILRRRGATSER